MKAQVQRAQNLLDRKNPKPIEALAQLKPLMKTGKEPWPVYHFAGVAYALLGDHERCAEAMRAALDGGSTEPETFHTLSVALYKLENYAEAESFAKQALQMRPDFVKALLNLGLILQAQARLEEALQVYARANQLDPRNAVIAFNIAMIYRNLGNFDKALELFDIAAQMDPTYHAPVIEKASALIKTRDFEKSDELLRDFLQRNPNSVEGRSLLADSKKDQSLYDEAITLYKEVLDDNPRIPGVRVNYGLCLQEMGRYDEAEKEYLRALDYPPTMMEAMSNYLMVMHYNPERTREYIFEAHKKWDETFAPAERPERPVPADRSPSKRLRVGFVSGGFRSHPVGWMITRGLEELSREEFEVYCYTNNNINDKITQRIATRADKWRSVVGFNDAVVAKMIREDEIDILVELSGHAGDNRLRAVAMEPAPVIMKWVGGLFNTTGLRAVDYLLSDWHETPEGVEDFYTEKLVRMPDDYICFMPPAYAPEVSELPAVENGFVTFGCFNNPSKINPVLLAQWGKLMARVPGSKLFLKSGQYDSVEFQGRVLSALEDAGIDRDRVIFEGRSPHEDLLAAYAKVDIALDPWPYSGGLSTCEALWQGVPVVTYAGPTFAGRHSVTHLRNAGLPEMVADSWDAYVDVAAGLAGSLAALAGLRARLRDQVAASPLCDGARFGAALSDAFRQMWHAYAEGRLKQDHIAVSSFEDDKSTENTPNIQVNRAESKVIDSQTELSINDTVSPEKPDHLNRYDIDVPFIELESKNGYKIMVPDDISHPVSASFLEHKQWYEPEINFLDKIDRHFENYLIIGGRCGELAFELAKSKQANKKITIVEKNETFSKLLRMGVDTNDFKNISVISQLPNIIDFEVLVVQGDVSHAELNECLSSTSVKLIMLVNQSVIQNHSVVQDLNQLGFEPFKWLSSTQTLSNSLLINSDEIGWVIWLKMDLLKKLDSFGLLHSDQILPAITDNKIWFDWVSKRPWSKPMLNLWDTIDSQETNKLYLESLNLAITSFNSKLSGSQRTNALIAAAEGFIALYNQGIRHYSLVFSLTRVLVDLNKIEDALFVMKASLTEKLTSPDSLFSLPFLTPISIYDEIPVKQHVTVWGKFRAIEAWILLKAAVYTMQHKEDRKFIRELADSPESFSGIVWRNTILEGNHKSLSEFMSMFSKQNRFEINSHKKNKEVDATISIPTLLQNDNYFLHIFFNNVHTTTFLRSLDLINATGKQKHVSVISRQRSINGYDVPVDEFMYASFFDSVRQLDQIIRLADDERTRAVIIHGIFFPWQHALLDSISEDTPVHWLIWGGDLYNPIKQGTPITVSATRIDGVIASLEGEYNLFCEYYGTGKSWSNKIVFSPVAEFAKHRGCFIKNNPNRIIIGNSGDPSNEHVEIINILSNKSDINEYDLFIPYSYNGTKTGYYEIIAALKRCGLYSKTVVQTEFIEKNKYLDIIANSGYFIGGHHRQQANATIMPAAYYGNVIVMRDKINIKGKLIDNPHWKYYADVGLAFTSFDQFKSMNKISDLNIPDVDKVDLTQKIIRSKMKVDIDDMIIGFDGLTPQNIMYLSSH